MAARRSGRTRPSTRSIGRASRAAMRTSRRQSSAFTARSWRRWRAFSRRRLQTPSPRLSAGHRALVLNLAGFRLRALGRLEDAAEPMRAAVEAIRKQKTGKRCAVMTQAISASCWSPSAGFRARMARWRRAKRPLPSRTALAMPSGAWSCAPPMRTRCCRQAPRPRRGAVPRGRGAAKETAAYLPSASIQRKATAIAICCLPAAAPPKPPPAPDYALTMHEQGADVAARHRPRHA